MTELTWGGIQYSKNGTYLYDPVGDRDVEVGVSDMAIVGIPYEGGQSSTTGQFGAPFAIRRYEHFESWQTHDIGNLSTVKAVDAGDLPIGRAHAQEDMLDCFGALDVLFGNTRCPVILGGDHSVSAATSTLLADQDKKIDLVTFDAHTDTWNYEADEERFPGHASWVRWVVERNLVGRVFQFGVRAMGPNNHAELKTSVQTSTGQVAGSDIERFLAWHVRERPEYRLHLSVDLDVVEPAMCPGVSYPEPGGWLPGVLLRLIETVVATGRVEAVDITEVTPSLDVNEMSVRLAHRSVLAVMRGIKRAQAGGAEVTASIKKG